MIAFPANIKVYLAVNAVDFRRGFDGLHAIVKHVFGKNILGGDIFVFMNKRANQVRLLFWDRDGLCLVTKRLEKGTFRKISAPGGAVSHVEVNAAQMLLLLEGIDVTALKKRKRFSPQKLAS